MCDFCEKKAFFPMRYRCEGIGTMSDNIRALLGDLDCVDASGIRLEEAERGPFLKYDNSAKEYAAGVFPIFYCPLCGRKLKEDANI